VCQSPIGGIIFFMSQRGTETQGAFIRCLRFHGLRRAAAEEPKPVSVTREMAPAATGPQDSPAGKWAKLGNNVGGVGRGNKPRPAWGEPSKAGIASVRGGFGGLWKGSGP
jgi:hypothetical protein